MSTMTTYVCTLTLPGGKTVVAKARADSLEEDVSIEWSGATDRIEPIVRGKYSVSFLQWYLDARARQLLARIEFGVDGPSEAD